MIKLFISLYFVIFASFVVFFVLMLSVDSLKKSDLPGVDDVSKKLTQGTFMLLERSISGRDKKQIESIIQQDRAIFGMYLRLFELSELPFDGKTIARIKHGEIVSSDLENEAIIRKTIKETGNTPVELDLVYKRVPNTSLVLRLNIDVDVDIKVDELGFSLEIVSGRFIDAMYHLLQQVVLKEPEEKWSHIIEELQPEYGLPLSLYKESTLLAMLKDNKKGYSRVISGETINISLHSSEAILVKRIPNSNTILQIGPLYIPWILRYFVFIIIMLFALSIAIILFLWVYPFWLNLIKIKQAADEFGSGNYSARIPYKKYAAIAKIASAFNHMAEQTQRSIRSHKELTSAVSHELRTPVARMRFALEMLTETNNKNDQHRFIKDINKDIDELDLLLEELLTYARFDRQDTTIKPQEVPLVAWMNKSIKKLMPLAKQKKLQYQINGIVNKETAQIDPRLMSRVLDNLVQNGLRYAKQQVVVTLSKQESEYILAVEDDGNGIPKAKRAHVFDAFSRLDSSRNRTSGGFGLGLAIAERIVIEHQGTISIHDATLGGARFEVRFK